jgi:large subunit ribosomal protein L14
MVFTSTTLFCIDNSGALTVKCLKILGKSPRARGFPGDYVIVSIKTHRPHRKVKRGEVFKGVLARVAYRIKRHSNVTVQCTTCAVVLLNKRELPLGSRVLGPVMRELREKKHFKILNLAQGVI